MKNDKKELIFDALEQLMSRMAYKDISVDTIAKQAGIGKGSIYYYFESKDEILYAVVERSYRRALHDFFDEMQSKSELSALDKIKQLFKSMIKKDFGSNEKNLLITLHLHDDLTLHSKMKYAAVQEIAPVLTELLKEGTAEGTIKTSTPRESAEMIVTVLTFILDDMVFHDDAVSIFNKLKILARVFEISLEAEPGSFDFIFKQEQPY